MARGLRSGYAGLGLFARLECLQQIPLSRKERTVEDFFHLLDQHAQLRDGVLGIGRDGQAVVLENQKLMPGPRVRTLKAQGAQPADKLPPFTGRPSKHKRPAD